MDQQPNPIYTAPAQPSAKKKWLRLALIGVTLLAVAAAIVLILSKSSDKQPEQKKEVTGITGSKEFKMTTDGAAIKYAGQSVYDACALIPFDSIKSTVNNFQTILDMNGTDKKPTDPLTIEHRYIDRDIPSPLGKDGQPRPTGTIINGQAKDALAFISQSDSNCWYGQGSGLSIGTGKTFAKVYVTQRPTPLSADFLAYTSTLTKAGSQGDLVAYVEPQKDSGGFITGIVTNVTAGIAVMVKVSTVELGQKATLEVMNTLTQAPKAPMELTYPLSWTAMPNPCKLLTADDFQRATGKPASALAEDTLSLNEVGGRLMQRTCERLEVERLDNTPISRSNVAIRLADTESNAKKYNDQIRRDNETQQLKQKINVADDAYVRIVKAGDKVTAREWYMRIGTATIILSVETDSGVDASADAFAGRILPLATSVAGKYRQSQ